jgi:dienelactone hydrolase
MRASLAACSISAPCSLPALRRSLGADGDASPKPGLNRFPRMVQEYYVAEVRRILRERRDRLAALKTAVDAERYVATVREKIQNCFGPWPERTPLKPQVTGVVERDAYRIEKVIFESRPQFFVTANLYVPKGLKGKAPGVVGSCGHSANGKAAETYQSFAQGLARQGYVVLIFDPIGQGERLQLPTEADVTKSKVGIGVREHLMVGNQQFLVGEFFGSWRAWDGIRALDYLLSRDEVDPQHVGVTGNSGGGTMSTWLCGVERRWTMGAPSCFVTSFLRNLENELPADTEQCPPNVLAEGLDHGDFLIAMAPHPVIMMGQERDYFDVRGLTDTYHDVRRVYELLGAEKNAAMFIGANDHGYHQDAREAMYAHFNRATGRGDAPVKEPALTMETDATLQCTKSGQVAELQSRPVYSFTKETAQRLAKERGEVDLRQATDLFLKVAKISPCGPIQSQNYRILRSRSVPEYPLPHATTYVVDVEPGIAMPIYRLYARPHQSRPPQDGGPAILYVAHDSSDVELRSEQMLRDVIAAEPKAAIYAVDVRGLGESRPNTCGENTYGSPYGCDYFYAAHAIMRGQPYVGRRVDDLSHVLHFIRDVGGHRSVHLVARGCGAMPAAMISVFSETVTRVTLRHAPTSFADIASSDVYGWPLSSLLPGVLKQFDLPDVYRELKATKQLQMIDPVGADGPG